MIIIKILHVLKSNKFSGAENVVCQIIHLFEDNSEYEFLYTSPLGPIKETLKEKNIQYEGMKKISVMDLKKIIKDYKPDIIHAHDMTATVVSSIFASKNTKVISHIHGTFKTLSDKNLKSFVFYQAARRCEKIIFVSQETYDAFIFKEKLKSKCILLKNIIDPNEINQKVESDDFEYINDLIFLGRLSPVKNPERFLEIVEMIKHEIPNVKTAIVGDGELKEKLQEEIQNKGLEKNIKMYGFMKNPYKLLQKSKILVMTSISEGLPMACLEAMALGKPIVSTPVDGLKEIVSNKENGYLSNSNDELADFIIEILKNEQLLNSLSKKAKEKFYNLNDLDVYRKTLDSIYGEK